MARTWARYSPQFASGCLFFSGQVRVCCAASSAKVQVHGCGSLASPVDYDEHNFILIHVHAASDTTRDLSSDAISLLTLFAQM